MKRFSEYIGVLILISIVFSTILIHTKLNTIRDIVREAQTPKVTITNMAQFSKLCNQFTTQWKADGYSFYLLQPKSSIKTHKEKASSSINYDDLPVRVNLTDDNYKEKLITYKFLSGDKTFVQELLHTSDIKCKSFLLIPIYQNDIIIGELYLFYNDLNTNNNSSIMNKVSEAQLLGRLLN